LARAFVAVADTPVVQPFDKVRKVVARRLTEAKQTIPHFYLRVSARVDELVALRKTANVVMGTKASINDYLVKAVGMALARHPDVNVQAGADAVRSFPAPTWRLRSRPQGPRHSDRAQGRPDAHRPDRGDRPRADRQGTGWTPQLRGHGRRRLQHFEPRHVRDRGVRRDHRSPPQGAILAVGGINRVAVETADGDIAFESQIKLSLSVDHRAIDGAAGAGFLQTLKALIEAPESLFARPGLPIRQVAVCADVRAAGPRRQRGLWLRSVLRGGRHPRCTLASPRGGACARSLLGLWPVGRGDDRVRPARTIPAPPLP
jgi:pyruvate dehydrogenase E2 component (dihydrolipoamide acetyltransferase)